MKVRSNLILRGLTTRRMVNSIYRFMNLSIDINVSAGGNKCNTKVYGALYLTYMWNAVFDQFLNYTACQNTNSISVRFITILL